MIRRKLTISLEKGLSSFPVVSLLGPRQVGKTTLANEIVKTLTPSENQTRPPLRLDLERPSDLHKLEEAELFLEAQQDRLVIIDEVQRKPDIFPLLRALVDANPIPGRFLLLGSSSPDVKRQGSESLAGRILEMELAPFLIDELPATPANAQSLWLRGGYPKSFLADSDSDSYQWRTAFISTHLERDIPQLGIRIPATTLFRFWQMLAHSHGQLWNAAPIASAMQVGNQAIQHYLDILESTFMLRRLPPFYTNLKKRLIKSPKVYFRDSGLLHALLGLEDFNALSGHPGLGASWEGWALEQVLGAAPPIWRPSFYRTQAGAELDLILEKPGKKPVAFEFKYSSTPQVTKGFWSALNDTEPERAYVIAPIQEAYPLKTQTDIPVTVIPLKDLAKVMLT